MKIGILSMQKVINYGSFLQAYGLRKLIKSVYPEEEINFIDIIPGRKLDINDISKSQKIKSILSAIKNGQFFEKIKDKVFIKNLLNQFETEFFPLLNLNSENNFKQYSTVVIGSDEVFHCTQNTPWGFSTQLLGDINNADNIISYAASFGATTYDDILKAGILDEVKNALLNLNSISVRDENSKKIIYKILNKEPEIHLDPVLISDFDDEIKTTEDFISNEKYMVVYSYTGRINNKSEIENIKNFAKKNNLKIYTIFCRYRWADKTIIPKTPFQMLKIFQQAEYVVSDTFHGTIFSIISHKKFCTLVRNSNKEKITSLLGRFSLESHTVFDAEELENKIMQDIDYFVIDNIRDIERNRSLEYLKKNLR